MAHTKNLLDAGSIDDVLAAVEITSSQFKNDEGKNVEYNSLVLRFENGDEVRLKATPELKHAVYYATNFVKK